MAVIDDKITAFIEGKPLLKAILILMTTLLGAARGRGWFAKRYGL